MRECPFNTSSSPTRSKSEWGGHFTIYRVHPILNMENFKHETFSIMDVDIHYGYSVSFS